MHVLLNPGCTSRCSPQNATYRTTFFYRGFLQEHVAATQVQMDPGSNGLEREQRPLKSPETIMNRHMVLIAGL